LQISGARTGEFELEKLPTLTGGLQWDVVYHPNSVVFQVVNFYGDYSGNGVVDAADYVVWRNSVNEMGINHPADGDRNRVVNQLDYDLWRSKFGQTAGSAAGVIDSVRGNVPEPSTLLLAAPILLFLRTRAVKTAQTRH
jgi:hypothetical protein